MTPDLQTLLPGLRLPLFQAPMAGVSTPALAAAVSLAGGVGALGLGAASAERAHDDIVAARQQGAERLNVNLFCHAAPHRDARREQAWIAQFRPIFADFGHQPPTQLEEIYTPLDAHPAMLEVLLDTAPSIVSFHFGLPTGATLHRLHQRGIVTAATATSVSEARQIAAAGIGLIVAQGIEAGGHRGCFDPHADDEMKTTLTLVRAISRAVALPVIAAGGIMDGGGIARALAAGAVAAQLGTAFITCPESAADNAWRARLLSPLGVETALTSAISGRPARGIVNRFYQHAEGIPDYPVAYSLGKALHQAAAARDCHEYAAYWAGAGANHCRAMPASQLVQVLAAEWQQASSAAL